MASFNTGPFSLSGLVGAGSQPAYIPPSSATATITKPGSANQVDDAKDTTPKPGGSTSVQGPAQAPNASDNEKATKPVGLVHEQSEAKAVGDVVKLGVEIGVTILQTATGHLPEHEEIRLAGLLAGAVEGGAAAVESGSAEQNKTAAGVEVGAGTVNLLSTMAGAAEEGSLSGLVVEGGAVATGAFIEVALVGYGAYEVTKTLLELSSGTRIGAFLGGGIGELLADREASRSDYPAGGCVRIMHGH